MEYRYLGKSGVKVSELCLGTMTFGKETEEQTAQAMIDRFLEAGGNFIDTANVYGNEPGASEKIVGRALKGKRQKIILATKVNFSVGPGPNERGLSKVHIMQAIEASLERLQTDHVDLYYVHCWDSKTPLEETLATLDNLVKSGKVRYPAVSNFTAWQVMKALGLSDRYGWQRFICLQPQHSLVMRDIERELLPLCIEEGLGVVPWSPLGGGFLSGKYRRGENPPPGSRITPELKIFEDAWERRMTERNFCIIDVIAKIADTRQKSYAQVALAWLGQQPGVTSPVIGAKTIEQLEDNLGSVGWDLTSGELEALDKVSQIEDGYPYRVIRRVNRSR